MTVRRRGKSRVKHTCTARTTSTIVAALFKVGSPTRMSTWPTAISCRSNASERVLSCSTSRPRAEPAQPEPVEIVRPHHHDVRLPSDARKDAAAEHLDRDGAGEPGQIELHHLRGSGEVADHEHRVASERPRERQHAMVVGLEEFDRPAAEDRGGTPNLDQAPRPVQERRRVPLLRLDIDGLIAVHGVRDERQPQALGIGGRKAGVEAAVPLHRRAHAVPIAQVDVVAHPDLVAVIQDRAARQRHQQSAHQLDAPSIAFHRAARAGAGCRG